FVAAAAPWFEGAPRFLARLAADRPFGDAPRLFARAGTIALAMPEDEQVELINAHPRLGAPPATVSADSFREQGYDRETTEAGAELGRLNAEYESRFGFRFCVFVAGRPRSALVPVLRGALAADRDAEIQRALRDVVAIARDRFERAVVTPAGTAGVAR
ncbi:MAG TPA: 2-oxo-4-hydroxy-4-carboxy-5-ureidoimidazoline decarboxylase, partial [Candidatus Limnocylindrales bacterium]|nr:2-oxo-4-hydroxy-4-carboxy-5-ureidoimidazoline decarboxylase [Candidatus Limnocylindrales bacterium]